jgi:hypothetical protein
MPSHAEQVGTGPASRAPDGDIGEEWETPREKPVMRTGFAAFLAIDASHGERKRSEPRLRNVLSTFDASPVLAGFQTFERGAYAVDRFEPHVHERHLDMLLDVDVGDLAVIQRTDVLGGGALFAD